MIPGKNDKNSYLVSVDTAGNTYLINLEGEVKIQKNGKWDADVFFIVTDLNSNGSKELLYISGDRAEAYSPDGKKGYSFKIDMQIGNFADVFSIKNKNYLVYLNQDKDKICVVDYQGKMLKNFPYPGNSGFLFYDINKDNNLELIRSEGNMLFISRF